MNVSPSMVNGVSPSPSLAVLTFVGVMGRPILSQKSLLTTPSAVHPESRMRSSFADFDGSWLLVTSTGRDGEGLMLSLLLVMVEVCRLLHSISEPVVPSLTNLIDFMDIASPCVGSVFWPRSRCHGLYDPGS